MEQLEGEQFFRALADETPQLMWLADHEGYIYWYNKCWYEYTGTKPEDMVGWGWQVVHDPKKLAGVLEHWKRSIETGQPFEMVFPLRSHNGGFETFLTRASPLKDDNGRVIRWFGTNTNIDKQIQTERHLELVVLELNHRVKNMLAMVQAIARQTLRSSSEVELDNFSKRLTALAGAHDVLAKGNWQAATLKDIIDQGLRSFGSRERDQLEMVGPEIKISSDRAATWAMAIHELATNAVKYGAWSLDTGKVQIKWGASADYLNFVWHEQGGPAVAVPQKSGFGTRLIKTIGTELGGIATISYHPNGIACEVKAPLNKTAQIS